MSLTVYVAAAHPIAAAQYARVLEAAPDVRLVQTAEGVDVGVFDGSHPALDTVLGRLMVRLPTMKPLLVWKSNDEESCLAWILKGVCGVVAYGRYEQDLLPAVQQVGAGRLWMPAASVVRFARVTRRARAPRGVTLTVRECEVLALVERRLSNKDIASVLRISERTAKFHVRNLMHKLQARSRYDLVEG